MASCSIARIDIMSQIAKIAVQTYLQVVILCPEASHRLKPWGFVSRNGEIGR